MTICCSFGRSRGKKKEEAAAQRQTAEITLALNYAAREQQQSLMLPTEMIQKSRQQLLKITIDEKATNNPEWDPLVSVASVASVAVQASAGTLLLLTCRSRRGGGVLHPSIFQQLPTEDGGGDGGGGNGGGLF